PPEMLGIKPPVLVSRRQEEPRTTRNTTKRSNWLPKETLTANLEMDPSLDTDRFDQESPSRRPRVEMAAPQPEVDPTPVDEPAPVVRGQGSSTRKTTRNAWKPGRSPLPSLEIGRSN